MTGKDAAAAVAKSDKSDPARHLANPPANTADADRPVTHLAENKTRGEATNHLQSYFLANITNEFRTPLAALNASLQYLLCDLDTLTIGEIRELLQPIHLSVIGLHTLIDNLIESTNIEAGHFSIRTGAIDIRAVVSDATNFTSPLFRRRNQHAIVKQPASLPRVVGDPPRLTQVMVNLLSSASKLGPMDQTIYVELELREHRWLRVSVSYRGPGETPATTEKRLVYPAQPETSGKRPFSVELGLSVARTIIEAHGGAAGVDQGLEGGSVYWFTVPAVEQR